MPKQKETLDGIQENIEKTKRNIISFTNDLHDKRYRGMFIYNPRELDKQCIATTLKSLQFLRKLKVFMIKNKMKDITKSEFIIFRDHYNKANKTEHWDFVR